MDAFDILYYSYFCYLSSVMSLNNTLLDNLDVGTIMSVECVL